MPNGGQLTNSPAIRSANRTTSGFERLWEVDALRGLAILMMVLYHLLFDLVALGGFTIADFGGFWRLWARATATLFITLAGLSLTLSYDRAVSWAAPGAGLFPKFLRRGLRVFGCGLLITAATWLLYPGEVVTFGILHFIGAGIVLAYPFLRVGRWNLLLGLACLAAGFALQSQDVALPFPWLLWLGLPPYNYATFDYFPLLPWFGLMLLGIWIGGRLYAGGRRAFPLPNLSGAPPVRLLGFLGRHSLLIYLIHQPILLGGLALLGVIRLG
jgi:uncharacterized membrane protein